MDHQREVLKLLCINGFKAFFISISMHPIQSHIYCKPTGSLLHFQIAWHLNRNRVYCVYSHRWETGHWAIVAQLAGVSRWLFLHSYSIFMSLATAFLLFLTLMLFTSSSVYFFSGWVCSFCSSLPCPSKVLTSFFLLPFFILLFSVKVNCYPVLRYRQTIFGYKNSALHLTAKRCNYYVVIWQNRLAFAWRLVIYYWSSSSRVSFPKAFI